MKISLFVSVVNLVIGTSLFVQVNARTTKLIPYHHQNGTETSTTSSSISTNWMEWGQKRDGKLISLIPSSHDDDNIEGDTTTTTSTITPSSDVPSTITSDTPSSVPSDMISSVPSTASSATANSLPYDAASSVPSDTPSTIQSDIPSSVPSDVPSMVIRSNTPSGLFSDLPSTIPSSIPTTPTTIFSEDAILFGLETLDLVGYSNIQSFTNSGDNNDTSKVLFNGNKEYNLDTLLPYTGLFDPEYYNIDGTHVTNIRSNETFEIPIYRSMTTEGDIIQFAINEIGNISFAEIRVPDPTIQDDIFFIPSDILRTDIGEDAIAGDATDVLISFTSRDLDQEKFGTIFDLDEVDPPILSGDEGTAASTANQVTNRRHRHVRRLLDDTSVTASEADADDAIVASVCRQFQIVKVAVIYDASLCSTYGSMAATRNRIINIVASASLYYEREICTKLQLVDVYTPDTTCGSRSASFTNQFNTASACRGDDNLLTDFSNWIRQQRNSIGIDRNAIVHLFSGAPKVTSTIGCAFTSSYCTGFPFGVEYATFSSNILAQAVVFAHEVAHNLGAPHITDGSNRFDYIMEASISSGSDGFGPTSSNTIQNYLTRVTCDTVQSGGDSPTTNSPPRISPSPPVPTRPSNPTAPTPGMVNGCPTNPEIIAPQCVSLGRVGSGGYACYSLNQLLPKDCTNVRWSISTCNGITIRNSPRQRLLSNLTLTFVEDDDDDDMTVQEDQASSLTFNPTSSGSNACSRSCVFSTKNRVCLRVSSSSSSGGGSSNSGGGSHVIQYRAVDRTNGRTIQSLQRTITIIQKNINNSCRPANLRCV